MQAFRSQKLKLLAFVCALLAPVCMLLAPAAAQTDSRAQNLAAAVDKKYNHLASLKMDFVEVYRGAGRERTESGTLMLKKPGRMRWDYRQPREKLFVSDGKTAYFYVPGERQARKASVKKIDDLRSPLRYLLGKTKLADEFPGLAVAEDVPQTSPSNVTLRGVPKRMADRVQQVLFEITPENRIQRITIEETDGSVTEFQFSNIAENAAVEEAAFHFTRPAGVELIESHELE